MSYLDLAKRLEKQKAAMATRPQPWNPDFARAIVADVLAEQERLNVKWPWPETHQQWNALWQLGEAIDDAFLAEDLGTLRQAVERWQQNARK